MLSVRDLTFYYKGMARPALDEIGFSVKCGEILGLLGTNGAGKSTLVSLIAGLLEPHQGRITLDGHKARIGRRGVAYVPQEYAFYEQLTVRQNLEFFATIQGLSSKSARQESLTRVVHDCQLESVLTQRAHACSGGEKRRVNLAISLLRVPQLLILDEPTAGVDPHARAAITRVVQELNKQGTTIVYTSHLLHEVQNLCDSLVLIHHGKLVCEGPMHSLLDSQAKKLRVQLDALSPDQEANLSKRFGPGVNIDASSTMVEFDLESCATDMVGCVAVLAELNLSAKSLDGRAENLESLFLTLTQSTQIEEQGPGIV